jgi:formylglycine-generating enzyme required for sulfatase activity/uncharacterized caspase-like protein
MSQNWAICIGIDRYDNLQALQFARRDAEALREFFEREQGFEKVYFFADEAPPIVTDFGQPMRSTPAGGALRRFLRVRFEQKFLKPSDNLWFFFAGHGRRERDRDYLMPSDADPGNVEETAIPVSHIAERLRRSGAANVILLLDACRNEGARDGEGIGAETQPGVVAVSSCRPSERSYEIDELQHGAFTYGLLEGLRLEGENNCATVERLDQYLRFRVPELCQLHKKSRQTPYTQAEPIEKRHLILLPRHASLADVEPLRLDALQAEAAGNLDAAEQLWWRVIAVSPVDAQAHEAIKRVALKEAASATGPIAAPIAEPPAPSAAQPRVAPRPARKPSRRRVIGAGALAVAAAGGGVVAWRSLHRSASPPGMSTIEFDYASVDENGRQERPRHAKAAVFSEDLGSRTGLDMVAIAAGRFMMGSPAQELERQPDEDPQHLVNVPAFFIGAGSVTQAQWLAVIIAHPARLQHDLNPNPSFFHGSELPVESITWYEAEEYCRRLSAISGRDYRLPSEAQWEYACRSGTTGPFNLGPTVTTDLANYCGKGGAVCGDSNDHSVASDSYNGVQYPSGAYGQGRTGIFRGTTTPAGTFPPNRFGLYDMHGNVWEYCRDIASANYNDAPQDGSAYLTGASGSDRIVRGGSWSHNPAICRSAYRDSASPDDPGWQGRIGFRVVCLS